MTASSVRLSGLVLVLALVAGTGCKPTPKPSPGDLQYGELGVTFDVLPGGMISRSVEHDFGSVLTGHSRTAKMRVKNLAAGRLKLESLAPTSSEAAPQFAYSFSTQELGPGETTEIPVTFTAGEGETADFSTTLRLVASGAPEDKATAIIQLHGVRSAQACAVPASIEFGVVRINRESTQAFTVTNPTDDTVRVELGEPLPSPSDFSFAAGGARFFVLEPGASREVAITFRPTHAIQTETEITLDAAFCGSRQISLKATVAPSEFSWSPTQVDCGYVRPGQEAQRDITFKNDFDEDVELSDITTRNGTEFYVAKASDGDKTKLTVPGHGGTATLTVTCKPALLAGRQTTLTFDTSLPSQPSGTIILKVYGGGPSIEVAPANILDFHKVAWFAGATPPSSSSRKVIVRNAGTPPGVADVKANLHLGRDDGSGSYAEPYFEITPLNAQTGADEFRVTVPATYDNDAGLSAKTGLDSLALTVTLTPSSVGHKEAELKIFSNDGDQPEVTLTLTADVVVVPACNYRVEPTALDFGRLRQGQKASLSIDVTNLGTAANETCFLYSGDLTSASDHTFSIVGGAVDFSELAPGETKHLVIEARPTGSAAIFPTGALSFEMSSPSNRFQSVPLTATLGSTCLELAPNDFDFGTVNAGVCGSATRAFRVYNTCSTPVTIDGIRLQAAAGQQAGGSNCAGPTACPEFAITSAPAIGASGLVLQPKSAPVVIELKYSPVDSGDDLGALALDVSGPGAATKYLATLRGRGGLTTQTDTFVLPMKGDVAFVINGTSTMLADQQTLGNNLLSFLQYAQSQSLDYRLAVTTADMGTGGAQGRFFYGPTHPETFLQPTTVDVEDKFKAKVKVGTSGGGPVMIAEAALAALTTQNPTFIRDDASLAIVALTDVDDESPDTTSSYLDRLWNVKGHNAKNAFTFNSVAPLTAACVSLRGTAESFELEKFADATGGDAEDLCMPGGAPAQYARLGERAMGGRTTFFLNAVPDSNAGSIQITVDGIVRPAVTSLGVTAWTFDPVANAIVFDSAFAPTPGQRLEITFPTTCYAR